MPSKPPSRDEYPAPKALLKLLKDPRITGYAYSATRAINGPAFWLLSPNIRKVLSDLGFKAAKSSSRPRLADTQRPSPLQHTLTMQLLEGSHYLKAIVGSGFAHIELSRGPFSTDAMDRESIKPLIRRAGFVLVKAPPEKIPGFAGGYSNLLHPEHTYFMRRPKRLRE
ncbi:MAG: hypothetical protein ABH863_00965 [Candidatus Micrarchaeota archaeon]